jgi:4-amino-4-deoxy-L-arabinose transferase-like glycosyltransferase
MKNRYYLLFVPIAIVYLIGMVNDIMEVDASQYASMSREMLESGNYLQLYDRGQDYLDKPPLLFWVSAVSYKLFGISNFSYKLPSVLFSLLGIFATLQLGKRLYGQRVGFYAALILASCQGWFMSNQDIRTDTILAACTIFAIWQLFIFMDHQKWIHLFLGSLGVAGAMLTKGPIGLMVPALSIGFYLLVKRDWRNLLNWRWLVVVLLVTIFISPFLYGLYQQYDLHPGKLIAGVPTASGIRFYLWSQSFGRITGESIWRDDSTPLFFTHTFLWAFLPWCVLFVVAFWRDTKQLIVSRFKMINAEIALSWGGFLFPFIAFSLSNYKLPHYIFVIFPLAAISTAKFVDDLLEELPQATRNIFKWIQLFVAVVVFALGIVLCTWAFPLTNVFYWALISSGLALMWYLVFRGKNHFEQIIVPSVIAISSLNFLLNVHFYPTLFQFTSTNQAAKVVKAMGQESKLYTFNSSGYGLDVYTHRTTPNYATIQEVLGNSDKDFFYVFTNEKGRQELLDAKLNIVEEKKFPHFHISTLSIQFVNPTLRSTEVSPNYLLKIDK